MPSEMSLLLLISASNGENVENMNGLHGFIKPVCRRGKLDLFPTKENYFTTLFITKEALQMKVNQRIRSHWPGG